mgnify:CR=1 FL=1
MAGRLFLLDRPKPWDYNEAVKQAAAGSLLYRYWLAKTNQRE